MAQFFLIHCVVHVCGRPNQRSVLSMLPLTTANFPYANRDFASPYIQ